MRLVIMSDGDNVHTRRWSEYFSAQGDEVLLLSCEDAVAMPVPSRRLGPRLPVDFLTYTLSVPAARRALADWRPDLVNAHFLPNYGWMARWLNHHPWVLSTWGSDVLLNPHRSPLHRWRARHVLAAADLVTSDAEMLSAACRRLAAKPIEVLTVPMGIDRALLERPSRAGLAAPVIFHNRNLEAVYDVATVLRGLAEFFSEHPDWTARFAGGGSLAPELKRLAGELGISDRVRWLGRLSREALMDELAQARVYLSASLSDSTSVSLLEAMALGVYPVLSDIPANGEWIEEPTGGSFFPCGDASALAGRLARVVDLSEAQLAEVLARNRREVQGRAVWEDNMATVRDAYLALLERSS